MDYKFEIISDLNGGTLIRILCPTCDKLVRITGVPIRVSNTNDKKEDVTLCGVMFPRPAPHRCVS